MDDSAPQPRLFTLDEATVLLPRVRDLIETIQRRAAQLGQLQERLETFRETKRRGEHEAPGEARLVQEALVEAQRISEEMQGAVQDLLAMGCELKDVRMGLVDFPARRDDRTVYLCWRLGEEEIRFWHELDTGFGGRQPL